MNPNHFLRKWVKIRKNDIRGGEHIPLPPVTFKIQKKIPHLVESQVFGDNPIFWGNLFLSSIVSYEKACKIMFAGEELKKR